jgi:hypothetical protein
MKISVFCVIPIILAVFTLILLHRAFAVSDLIDQLLLALKYLA